MIKANELRIGNWLKRDTQPEGFLVDSQSFFKVERHPDWYDPIPLTPEILKKCGFNKKKIDGYIVYYKDVDQFVSGSHTRGRINLEISLGDECSTQLADSFPPEHNVLWLQFVVYVHQLQNLYFALTGEELEINLNHTAPSPLH